MWTLWNKIYFIKNIFWKFYEVRSERGVSILALLGIYFDAVVVFVTNSSLLFRFAVAINVATGFETGTPELHFTLTYPWIRSSFLHRFVDDFTIEELCMTGYESLDGPEFVKPILPPMEDHPGLKVAKSQKLFSFSYQCRISFFNLVKK